MLALPSSTAATRPVDLGVPGVGRRLRESLLSHITWKLHQVIAHPGSSIEEARKAKRVLLSAIEIHPFQRLHECQAIMPGLLPDITPTNTNI